MHLSSPGFCENTTSNGILASDLVKIVKDSYYEKYKFAENEMNNGLIEIYGYMDDGQEIEVQYDLVGNYIYYVNYKYW